MLYRFAGGSDGGNPHASLIFDAAGNLYGTTHAGGGVGCGGGGCGTVFKLAHGLRGKWIESVIYAFTGGNDGALPLLVALTFGERRQAISLEQAMAEERDAQAAAVALCSRLPLRTAVGARVSFTASRMAARTDGALRASLTFRFSKRSLWHDGVRRRIRVQQRLWLWHGFRAHCHCRGRLDRGYTLSFRRRQ